MSSFSCHHSTTTYSRRARMCVDCGRSTTILHTYVHPCMPSRMQLCLVFSSCCSYQPAAPALFLFPKKERESQSLSFSPLPPNQKTHLFFHSPFRVSLRKERGERDLTYAGHLQDFFTLQLLFKSSSSTNN